MFRVELELRSRFLRHYEIHDPFDFHKLVSVLPEKHVQFVRLDWKRLTARLRRMGPGPSKIQQILQEIAPLDVWSVLYYLRQEMEMKNTRRLVDPHELNQAMEEALKKWAAMWPTAPTKLTPRK